MAIPIAEAVQRRLPPAAPGAWSTGDGEVVVILDGDRVYVASEVVALADVDFDGRITVTDLIAFTHAWSARDPSADLDRDGTISAADVRIAMDLVR